MAKNVNIIPEEINLIQIDILESSIKDLPKKEALGFNLNVGHSTMHNLDEQRVKIGLVIDLDSESNLVDGKAHFVFDFHYQIQNLSNFYQFKENGEPLFSGIFISTLIGLSFSTARGIIFERLLNTNLQGIILPVVDPKKILLLND